MIEIIVGLIVVSAWGFVIYEIKNAPTERNGKLIKRKRNEKTKKSSL